MIKSIKLIPKAQHGNKTKKVDWDKTITGKLINYSENPDSIGYSDGKWYAPTQEGFDPNQFGMGVDRRYVPNFDKYIKTDSEGREYITEEDERMLRYMKIDEANDSANARYKYAQKATKNPKGTISPINDALTVSAIYNLGRGRVANGLFENNNAMKELFKRANSKWVDFINSEYAKDGKSERIKLQTKFLKKYK